MHAAVGRGHVFTYLLFSKSSKMAVGPNLFDMTESTVNSLKKPEIGKKIMKLKVVVAEEIKSHCI